MGSAEGSRRGGRVEGAVVTLVADATRAGVARVRGGIAANVLSRGLGRGRSEELGGIGSREMRGVWAGGGSGESGGESGG